MPRNGLLLGLVALLLAGALPPSAGAVSGDGSHTREIAGGSLAPPVGRKWIRRDLKPRGRPLVADGRVFLTVTDAYPQSSASDEELTLVALRRDTGETLWRRPTKTLTYAYADGVLFHLPTLNRLEAVDAASGSSRWSASLGTAEAHPFAYVAEGGAPTVDGDLVVVGYRDTLQAFRASDGFKRWTADAYGASDGRPAIDADRVYTVGGCNATTAYSRLIGVELWSASGDCVGGGGGTPVLRGDRVYSFSGGSQDGLILDAQTGAERGTFAGGTPSFAEGLLLTTTSNAITAQRSNGTIAWRFARDTYEDVGVPVTVGGTVWTTVGSSVVGLDAATGAVRQEIPQFPLPEYSDSAFGSSSSTEGVGSDGSWLVFAGAGRVTGMAPGADTPGIDDPDKPRGDLTELRLNASDRLLAPLSRRAVLNAEARRGGDTVDDTLEIQADPYPYDGRWETIARLDEDTSYRTAQVRPSVNTRYRVVNPTTAPVVTSRALELRLDLRLYLGALKVDRRRRVRISARADVPPALSLRRRWLYVYRKRMGKRLATRVGRVRLRAAKRPVGRYRARKWVRVRGFRDSDRIVVCFRNPRPRAFGRPIRGKDPCGRKRI